MSARGEPEPSCSSSGSGDPSDAVEKLLASRGKKLLGSKGIYVKVGADSNVSIEEFYFLKALVEEGKLMAIIDKTYPLEQIVEAQRYVEKGHKKGHVAITVAHNR